MKIHAEDTGVFEESIIWYKEQRYLIGKFN